MKFGLQKYGVYCYDPQNHVNTLKQLMAVSPEDAKNQLSILGYEHFVMWITEESYGDY